VGGKRVDFGGGKKDQGSITKKVKKIIGQYPR